MRYGLGFSFPSLALFERKNLFFPAFYIIGGARSASAATCSQVIKIENCDNTCIVHTCESTLQAVAIGGWLQSGRSRVRALLWNSFFSPPPALSLLFFPLSFPPFPLFLPSLPFISPPSFFSFMLAPPLQCSSIFLVKREKWEQKD